MDSTDCRETWCQTSILIVQGIFPIEQRLSTLFQRINEKADRAMVDAKYTRGQDRQALQENAALLHAQAELMSFVFWFEVRRRLKEWKYAFGLGVRAGGKVVQTKHPPMQGFFQFEGLVAPMDE